MRGNDSLFNERKGEIGYFIYKRMMLDLYFILYVMLTI